MKHVERPRAWNIPALTAVFQLLELPPGMAQLVAQGKDEPVQALQKAVVARVDGLVMARQALQAGFLFWGRNLLDEHARNDLRRKLDAAKEFLESLQSFSSPGKLKNFPYSRQDVAAQSAGQHALLEIEAIRELVGDLGHAASYLSAAEPVLPPNHRWVETMKALRETLVAKVLDPAQRSATGFRQQAQRELGDLKRAYIDVYLQLHTRARLGVNDDKRKERLLADERLRRVKRLTTIDLMPRQQVNNFQKRLAALKSCFVLTRQDLDATVECPHCAFRPSTEPTSAPAGQVLSTLNDDLDALLSTWTKTLLGNLEDPTTQENLELLGRDQRDLVDAFITSRALPDDLNHDLIDALAQVLSGLSKVVVSFHDLRDALFPSGSPATLSEMRKRFEEYLDEKAKGMDPPNVRIVLEVE